MNYKEEYYKEKLSTLRNERVLPGSFLATGLLSQLLMISNGFKIGYVIMGLVMVFLGGSSLRGKNKEIKQFKEKFAEQEKAE